MNEVTRRTLEAGGFVIENNPYDFLGLTPAERAEVELRLAVGHAVRAQRKRANLTQASLAAKARASQSRVAKVENGSVGVSLDLAFHMFFEAGGRLSELGAIILAAGATETSAESKRRKPSPTSASTKPGRSRVVMTEI